jgi:hypothetical protein
MKITTVEDDWTGRLRNYIRFLGVERAISGSNPQERASSQGQGLLRDVIRQKG